MQQIETPENTNYNYDLGNQTPEELLAQINGKLNYLIATADNIEQIAIDIIANIPLAPLEDTEACE